MLFLRKYEGYMQSEYNMLFLRKYEGYMHFQGRMGTLKTSILRQLKVYCITVGYKKEIKNLQKDF